MRKILFVGVILSALWPACAADQSGLEAELVAADRGVWQAIAGPHPKLDEVSARLAPDYLDVDSGVQHSRADVFTYLKGLSNFSFQYESAHATVLSPTSGYVIAQLSYSSIENGAAAKGRVLTTTVFSKQHGLWLAHLHTEMDIKPEAH